MTSRQISAANGFQLATAQAALQTLAADDGRRRFLVPIRRKRAEDGPADGRPEPQRARAQAVRVDRVPPCFDSASREPRSHFA